MHFEFAYFYFVLIHLELKRYLRSYASVVLLRFQTKMGKVYTRFQTKKAQTPDPLGRHIPLCLI